MEWLTETVLDEYDNADEGVDDTDEDTAGEVAALVAEDVERTDVEEDLPEEAAELTVEEDLPEEAVELTAEEVTELFELLEILTDDLEEADDPPPVVPFPPLPPVVPDVEASLSSNSELQSGSYGPLMT